MKKGEKRLDWIDNAKGIGILLVVLAHLSIDENLQVAIYSFHLPLFFIISGMMLFHNQGWKKLNFKEFIIKKLKSLIYPYFTLSLFMFIMIVPSTLISHNFRYFITFIVDTLTFQGYSALWYLPNLFASEILFFVVYKYIMPIMKKNWNVVFLTIFYAFTAFLILFVYKLIPDITILKIINLKLIILGFILRTFVSYIFIHTGYIIFEKTKEFSVFKNKICLFFICLVLFIGSNLLSLLNKGIDLHYTLIGNNPLIYIICSIMGSITLLIMCYCLSNKLIF